VGDAFAASRRAGGGGDHRPRRTGGAPRTHAAQLQRDEPVEQVGHKNVANRDCRDFGRPSAHGAVSRRAPIFLDTIVPRTGGKDHSLSRRAKP
jgi:hypothetical protein